MEVLIILVLVEIFTLLMQRSVCENILEPKIASKKIQIFMWSIFFVCSNIGTYLWQLPVGMNLLIFATTFLLALSLLYNGTFQKKLLIVALLYILGMLAEFIIYQIGGVVGNNMEEAIIVSGERIVYAIASKLVWFIEIKILLLIMKEYHHTEVRLIDWIEVFFVPISSIIILFFMFEPYAEGHEAFKLVAASLILFINLFTFFLYGEIQEKVLIKAEKEYLMQQKESYAIQLQKNTELWLRMQKFRHEIKQSYLLVQTYLEQESYDKLSEYYAESLELLKNDTGVVDTGNICFDTIVNYKATIAKESGITIQIKAMIPYDIQLEEKDLCSLLGNLFDNAIEATEQLDPDERIIKVMARMSGNNMYLEIGNPYRGERKRKGDVFHTTKNAKKEHGIGMKIIRDIVIKHNGEIEIDTKDNYFRVSLLIYDIGK